MRYGHKRIERTTNGNGFILYSADSGFWMRSSPFISRLAISLAPMLETVLADNTIEFWLAPEVEQESQFQISRVEVAEELQGTVGTQAFGRFDLDYELSVDNHVERLASEWLAPEVHHYRDFTLGTMALGYQVTLEGKCIDVLSVAKSQLAVNIEKASDDRASEVGFEQLVAAFVFAVHPLVSVPSVHSVSSIRYGQHRAAALERHATISRTAARASHDNSWERI
jgi:hypothetical protein